MEGCDTSADLTCKIFDIWSATNKKPPAHITGGAFNDATTTPEIYVKPVPTPVGVVVPVGVVKMNMIFAPE